MKKVFIPTERPGILPTVYGFGFFTLIVDVFALGFFRNAGPYHTVGLTLIVLGMVAMIQTNTNMDSVSAEVIQSEPGEEGRTARVLVVLRNGLMPARYNLSLQTLKKFRLVDQPFVQELKTSCTVPLEIQCSARGVYHLQRIKIQSRGYYGLFSAWKWVFTNAKLIVYPKPEGHQPLPSADEGHRLRYLSGEDFVGHRLYQPGASLKQVDWKAYARGQPLLLKEFGSRGEGPLQLRYQDVLAETTEARLRQLSAWVFACATQNRPFSLELPGRSLAEGSGREQLREALLHLASFEEPA
ncbi:MAG: DUF58 domain-containing protein [Pseudobdellovibrionaceae bacterium]|nr:DUF58 domain-containing protein [Pseudobdellovibrionaceae bacterium]